MKWWQEKSINHRKYWIRKVKWEDRTMLLKEMCFGPEETWTSWVVLWSNSFFDPSSKQSTLTLQTLLPSRLPMLLINSSTSLLMVSNHYTFKLSPFLLWDCPKKTNLSWLKQSHACRNQIIAKQRIENFLFWFLTQRRKNALENYFPSTIAKSFLHDNIFPKVYGIFVIICYHRTRKVFPLLWKVVWGEKVYWDGTEVWMERGKMWNMEGKYVASLRELLMKLEGKLIARW
jgi:hypothetical protein